MARHRLHAFLLAALLSLAACQKAPVANHPAAVPPGSGKQWLAWQASNREDFVVAYIDGYFYGVRDACDLANLDRDYIKHASACRQQAPRYSILKRDSVGNEDVSAYADVLTKFYTEHPEYQNIPFSYLMRYLSDGQHKSADDLANMAKAGQLRAAEMGMSL